MHEQTDSELYVYSTELSNVMYLYSKGIYVLYGCTWTDTNLAAFTHLTYDHIVFGGVQWTLI